MHMQVSEDEQSYNQTSQQASWLYWSGISHLWWLKKLLTFVQMLQF